MDDQGVHARQDDSSKNPAAVALGKLGGLKGGHARAAVLTPERRSEIARIASRARWEKWKDERAAESAPPAPENPPPKNPAAVALGKLGGPKGGRARAEALSPERRSEIARIASRTRWGNKKKVVREADPPAPAKETPPPLPKNPAAVALGRLGAVKGGHARAEALSPERRSEIGRIASRARWA